MSKVSGSPTRDSSTKVLVALSGKMDSAVAAALLKSEGYRVAALHLVFPPVGRYGGFRTRCQERSAAESAREIARKLDIPFHAVSVEELFAHEVVDHYLHERLQSRRASPCVRCNSDVKFRALVDTAAKLGFGTLATGHYAQVSLDPRGGAVRLRRAVDRERDQSPLLFPVSAEVLSRTLMPLGGIPAALVKKLAQQFALPVEESPPCSDDCVPQGEALFDFIEKRTDPMLRLKGIVKSLEGKVVGEHSGLYRYRLGDRKEGLDASLVPPGSDHVVAFDWNPQSIVVGDRDLLSRSEVGVERLTWIRSPSGIHGLRCSAGVGAAGEGSEAEVQVTLFENDSAIVSFRTPAAGFYPGCAIVFYQGDEVLGGGVIGPWRKSLEPGPKKSPL